jgi:hypothetical protein
MSSSYSLYNYVYLFISSLTTFERLNWSLWNLACISCHLKLLQRHTSWFSSVIPTSQLLNFVTHTYVYITHSLMELSPSWEASNCTATQELPSILWNPEIHHRIHISPPSVPILSQIDPIHTTPSYLSKNTYSTKLYYTCIRHSNL